MTPLLPFSEIPGIPVIMRYARASHIWTQLPHIIQAIIAHAARCTARWPNSYQKRYFIGVNGEMTAASQRRCIPRAVR